MALVPLHISLYLEGAVSPQDAKQVGLSVVYIEYSSNMQVMFDVGFVNNLHSFILKVTVFVCHRRCLQPSLPEPAVLLQASLSITATIVDTYCTLW